MRILSQTGINDLPYEKVGICINFHNDREVIAYPINGNNLYGEYWILARYSTESKARKTIEMLHDAYMGREMYKLMNILQATTFLKNSNDCEKKYLNEIFQFPKDDEMEKL